MFYDTKFNQFLHFDTGSVRYMDFMFANTTAFNKSIDHFDTSQVRLLSHVSHVQTIQRLDSKLLFYSGRGHVGVV